MADYNPFAQPINPIFGYQPPIGSPAGASYAANPDGSNPGGGYYDFLNSQTPFNPSTYNSSVGYNPSGNTNNSSAQAAGNLVGGAIGAFEYFQAQKALKQLNAQPTPNYTVGKELQNAYNRAEGMAGQGFTPGEAAGYRNQISQGNATTYNRAVGSAGGNLSNVISAGINSQDIESADKYTIADASLRRQNMSYADSLAKEIQEQENMATRTNIANRNQLLQGWNQAATAGLSSFANSFSLGGIAKTVSSIGAS